MQLFNLSVAIAFLFSSTSANPGGPSSALQHVRRDHQPDPPMAYTYIMKDAFEEVDEKLAIHRPDGKVACYFQKNTHDLRRGKSNTVVKDFSGVDLLILRSGDDLCGKHSHYVSPDGIVVIEIDPRGLQSDQWILKRQIPSGYANFLFKRHTTNKNGRIYDANGNLVAELLNEIRYEPWLDPGQKGTRTYSLRVTATAPNLELVTMMALVLSRTDACGL